MSTLEQVRTIIATSKKIDPNTITGNTSFKDDLAMDSLELAEIIMEFEKTFNCEIPEDDAEKIVTVDDAIRYLESFKNN